jgi:uncharacterized phage protein gp47/JayE
MEITDLVFIDSTGYHYSDFPTFQAWLIAKYQGIYGADVYLEPDSQDGQFLAVLAQAFYDTAALGASVYSSFSPVTAQGAGLSRVVKINGLARQASTFSTVDVDIGGIVGKTITNGVAIDTLQQKWNLPASVTIPSEGTISVTATAQELGALNALPNTVTGIFTPTQGWQTVNNEAAATPGAPVETDAQLRMRQQVSTANPSLTVLDGTVGGVSNVPGVTDCRGYENDTGTTDANGIPAHSICIVAEGADDQAVADEIMVHKTPGTGTFGNTTKTAFDAHGMPLAISFSRPTIVEIDCTVTLSAGAGYSSGFETLIQQAVGAVINSFGIGNDILFTKLFAAAYLNGMPQGQTYDIASITLGKNGGSQTAANVAIAFNELGVTDPTINITIVVS